MQFKCGDVVDIKYRHPLWHTMGVVTRIWSKDSIQVTLLLPRDPNHTVGAFSVSELELLGHIDLEEGEKQNANRR